MESFDATLVFAVDPLSPPALVVGVATVALLSYYGYVSVRTAGRYRGGLLGLLRTLALVTLCIILLQPGMLRREAVDVALPDTFTHKEVTLLTPAEQAAMLTPLTSLSPPAAAPTRDVRVADVAVPPLAFFKSRSTVRITLANDGPPQDGEVVVSRLESDGVRELSRNRLHLEPGERDVAVEVVPEVLGAAAYSVSLRGFAEDADPTNNTGLFSLHVARESLRILHIAGHPSWDVRFLREFLTTMPGLEVISFYLLVEAEDFAPHSREELALIPFPTDELFLKELGNFDLVIVHNFPLGTYFLLEEEHHKRMAQFVEEGGALLFLGGDRAYRLGALHETPVARILPMELLPEADVEGYLEGAFQARLAPDGLAHPVMQQPSPDGEVPFRLEGTPALDGVNPLGEVRGGGAVLAWAEAGATRWPLVVAGHAGRGRVLAIATDALWRWAFPAQLGPDSPAIFRRLFANALGWLTRDPRRAELEIRPELERVEDGRETPLQLCIRGSAEPGSVARVQAEWLDVDGRQPSYRLELQAPLENSRCAAISLPVARPGAWTVEGHIETDRREFTGRDVVVVHPRRESYVDSLLRRAGPLLERRYAGVSLDATRTVVLEPITRTLHRPILETLWLSPAFFFLFVLLLLAEWVLRRRWGYL